MEFNVTQTSQKVSFVFYFNFISFQFTLIHIVSKQFYIQVWKQKKNVKLK